MRVVNRYLALHLPSAGRLAPLSIVGGERKLRASAVREQGDLMGPRCRPQECRPWHRDCQGRGMGAGLSRALTTQHKGTQARGSKAGPEAASRLVMAKQLAFLGSPR